MLSFLAAAAVACTLTVVPGGYNFACADTFVPISPEAEPEPPPDPPPALINTGLEASDSVIANVNLDVFDSCGGSDIGDQAAGELGTVTSGPTLAADNSTWCFVINWTNGTDGTVRDQDISEFTPEPPPEPAQINDFLSGDPVQPLDTGADVTVFDTPGGSSLGTQVGGAYGVVVGEWTFANDVGYFNINFFNGVDGFVRDDALEDATVPGNLFSLGADVSVIGATSNIRETPAGTQLGTQAVGAQGVITDGPVYEEGVGGFDNWWYEVDFTSGTDGWMGNNRLQLTPEPPPEPSADCTTTASPGASWSTLAGLVSNASSGDVICMSAGESISASSTMTMDLDPGGLPRDVTFSCQGSTINRTASVTLISASGGLYNTSSASVAGSSNPVVTSAGVAPNVTVGDWIKLAADDDLPGGRDGSSGHSATSKERMGQYLQITSKSGNAMTAAGQTLYLDDGSSYSTNVRAARLVSGRGIVLDCRFVGQSGQGSSFISTDDSIDFTAERISIDTSSGPGITLANSVNARVVDTDIRNLLPNSNNTNYGVRPAASIGAFMSGLFGLNMRHLCDAHQGSIAANTAGLGSYGGAFEMECSDSISWYQNTGSPSAFGGHASLRHSVFDRTYAFGFSSSSSPCGSGTYNAMSGRGFGNTWRNSAYICGGRGWQVFDELNTGNGRDHLADNVIWREINAWAYYDSGSPRRNRVCNSRGESYNTAEASNDVTNASCAVLNPTTISVTRSNTTLINNVSSDNDTWDDAGEGGTSDGPNLLFGGRGNDTINARGGNDIIWGGPGTNTLTGGSGRDRFWVNWNNTDTVRGEGTTTVTDFTAGTGGDIIDIAPFLAAAARVDVVNRTGFDPFTTGSGYVRTSQSGADCLVQIDVTGGDNSYVTALTLTSVTCSNLVYANDNGTTDNWRLRLRAD